MLIISAFYWHVSPLSLDCESGSWLMLDTDQTTSSVFFEMQTISFSFKIEGTTIRVAKTCYNILLLNLKNHLSISSHCSETEFLFDYWPVQVQDDAFMMKVAPSPVQHKHLFHGNGIVKSDNNNFHCVHSADLKNWSATLLSIVPLFKCKSHDSTSNIRLNTCFPS